MRIIAVQTGLSPLSVLGGTITDREFLTRLADRGVEVHLLTEAGEPVVEHERFVVHRWHRRLRKRLPYVGNADVALDLRRLLTEVGPVDWIRFNSPYSVGLGTVAAGGGHRIWGSYLHLEDYLSWRLIDRWLPSRCDLITCLSDDTRRDLVARCPSADHAANIVVPMGIDTTRFDEARAHREEVRASHGIADDEIVILFVGSLIARKGIADLAAAWRQLGDRSGVRLLLVAKPAGAEETRIVEELVREDDRVIHVPSVRYEEVPRYFAASDIFFFPTHLEGYGIVVGEAMASRLPVVTTRAQGVREVIAENETALAAEVGDTAELSRLLERLLDDPAMRDRLGRAGRARVEAHFTWDRIMDRLMERLGDPGARAN
jgi:glycosyltransferase involved in cell wall biosynthesis